MTRYITTDTHTGEIIQRTKFRPGRKSWTFWKYRVKHDATVASISALATLVLFA